MLSVESQPNRLRVASPRSLPNFKSLLVPFGGPWRCPSTGRPVDSELLFCWLPSCSQASPKEPRAETRPWTSRSSLATHGAQTCKAVAKASALIAGAFAPQCQMPSSSATSLRALGLRRHESEAWQSASWNAIGGAPSPWPFPPAFQHKMSGAWCGRICGIPGSLALSKKSSGQEAFPSFRGTVGI